MNFSMIPVAEASNVMTLMKSINKVIINPLIYFAVILAMVYFVFGLAQYLLNPESEDIRKTSKSRMLWGIIGLFIMVSVFGIMNILIGSIGGDSPVKIDKNTGVYTVEQQQ